MLIANRVGPGRLALRNTGETAVTDIRSVPPGFAYEGLEGGESVHVITAVEVSHLQHLDSRGELIDVDVG
jgi:hypothetical protein